MFHMASSNTCDGEWRRPSRQRDAHSRGCSEKATHLEQSQQKTSQVLKMSRDRWRRYAFPSPIFSPSDLPTVPPSRPIGREARGHLSQENTPTQPGRKDRGFSSVLVLFWSKRGMAVGSQDVYICRFPPLIFN